MYIASFFEVLHYPIRALKHKHCAQWRTHFSVHRFNVHESTHYSNTLLHTHKYAVFLLRLRIKSRVPAIILRWLNITVKPALPDHFKKKFRRKYYIFSTFPTFGRWVFMISCVSKSHRSHYPHITLVRGIVSSSCSSMSSIFSIIHTHKYPSRSMYNFYRNKPCCPYVFTTYNPIYLFLVPLCVFRASTSIDIALRFTRCDSTKISYRHVLVHICGRGSSFRRRAPFNGNLRVCDSMRPIVRCWMG